MAVRVTQGDGTASIASELISNNQYQQIKVVDGTAAGTTGLKVNADGSLTASVYGTLAVSGNPSVSGTVGASVIGWVPIQASNTSIITVSQSSSVIGVVTGSVVALPTGNQSVSGALNVAGSVLLGSSNASVITLIQGSVAVAFAAAANQSVSGTVGASVIGWVPIQASNTSIITVVQGSVAVAFAAAANQSVSGTVGVSVLGAAFGGQNDDKSNTQNGMVVTAFPYVYNGAVWDRARGNSSIGTLVSTGASSVITNWQAASIAGTYVEDTAHATGDRGLQVFQVRNDTMSSITSADGDYSPIAGGPVGETIVANAPITKWVQGTADLRGAGSSGSSVVVIAAQGASIFTYITGVQVANMGSASVLVTLAGTGSILAYTIAPAGGGSNIVYRNALKTPANGTFAASISGAASVLVSAQGFIAKI